MPTARRPLRMPPDQDGIGDHRGLADISDTDLMRSCRVGQWTGEHVMNQITGPAGTLTSARTTNPSVTETTVSIEPIEPEESWQDFANCLGVDPDLFFPERGASTKEAKAVCRACVVREDCLEYALENSEKFGIWGGLSERERRRLRRARALARAAQESRTA